MTVNVSKPRQIAYADQVCNPNLFYNGDFIVWQRGESFTIEGNKSAYTCDGWIVVSEQDGHITCTRDNGLKIHHESASTSNVCRIFEGEYWARLVTKGNIFTVTVQVYSEVTDLYEFALFNGGIYEALTPKVVRVEPGENTLVFTFKITSPPVAPYNFVIMQIWRGVPNSLVTANTLIIRRVKFEMGSTSTLHLDPTVNYAEELRKCQYYYYQSWPDNLSDIAPNIDAMLNYSVQGIATDYNFIAVELPVAIRDARTVSVYDLTGVEGKVSRSNWDGSRTSMDVLIYRTVGNVIGLAVPSADMQKGDMCSLLLKISAEL